MMICCTKIHLLVMSISVTSARSSTRSLGHQLGTAPTREGGHGLGMEESAQPQRLQHACYKELVVVSKVWLGLLGTSRPQWMCIHCRYEWSSIMRFPLYTSPLTTTESRVAPALAHPNLCPCLAQDLNRSHQARDHIPTSHHLCHSYGHQRVMEVILCQV